MDSKLEKSSIAKVDKTNRNLINKLQIQNNSINYKEGNNIKNNNKKQDIDIKKIGQKEVKTSSKNINDISLLKNIVLNSYSNWDLDNTFSVVKTINNLIFLIYSTRDNSIICYNLINNEKITEIRKAHQYHIINFRHFLDQINKRDLLLSISSTNNIIKIWNIFNFECLLYLEKINEIGCLYSSCFLNDNNQNLFLTSNFNFGKIVEHIKVFDLNGKKIKEINDSNIDTYFIDIYYDIKFNKNYILSGNRGFIKSYDYNLNDTYKIYKDNENFDNEKGHCCMIINNNSQEIIKIIESCDDGKIRIWNFHSGELLKKINVSNEYLYSISLWYNEYLFVGNRERTIKIVNINNGKIIKILSAHDNFVITIKAILLPKYGECLLSQGWGDGKIILWGYSE